MGGSVDVRGVMHRCRDALREHAGLRHIVDSLDHDVLEIGPVRRLVTEAVGQVVKLESHGIFEILFEYYAANSSGHGLLPFSRMFCLYSDPLPASGSG